MHTLYLALYKTQFVALRSLTLMLKTFSTIPESLADLNATLRAYSLQLKLC